MTAKIAVTRGMIAAITATCAEVVRCNARAIRVGQIKAVPTVT
ncbi:unannotated protein [freshwater metagenome]|uniref:Unannotated protein n=1 Tax=freshwater metagenome TaxID=449393 RepID=A0A6J7VD81_9ZZZZ